MAQVTFATAFGHPLGVQKNMTSVFVPYRGAVPPILFDLALVSGFASFGAPEEQIYFSGAQQQRNGPSDIRNCFWAPIGCAENSDICVCSLSWRRATHFVQFGFC